jgi:hypothetical protein
MFELVVQDRSQSEQRTSEPETTAELCPRILRFPF